MIINIILLLGLSYSQTFDSKEHRAIASEIVDAFSKQCSYTSSVESNIVRMLEEKLKEAQSQNALEALSCYRDNLTQITSVHYIYTTTCKEVTVPNLSVGDASLMRLFTTIQKYRKGIRLQHSILNDCLSGKNVDKHYIVGLEFNRIESDLLKERLEKYKIKDHFTSNRTTYR